MNHVSEKLLNLATYGLSTAGIIVNFENIKSIILFFGALVLLFFQIYLHILKIKNEKNAKNKSDNK